MASKYFEVGDVLPAGPVKIEFSNFNYRRDYHSEDSVVFTEQDSIIFITQEDYDECYEAYVRIIPSLTSNYSIIDDTNSEDIAGFEQRDMYCYIIIDFSNCTLAERTVISINGEDYGTWEDLNPTPTGYSVTFEENGGSTVIDLTEQTNLPSPLPTPTKANNVFAGWYYDNSFTQKANAGDELTTNVTLYAKWYTPTTWCEDIADAIREKEGSVEPIKHVDFPDRIRALEGAKPEETKTVTPNFSSGNVVVTPTSGKVMTQVTINKHYNLTPENIKKGVNIFGVVGTYEGGYSVYIISVYGNITFFVKDIYNNSYSVIVTPETDISLENITWIKLDGYTAITYIDGLTANQLLAGHTLTQDCFIEVDDS